MRRILLLIAFLLTACIADNTVEVKFYNPDKSGPAKANLHNIVVAGDQLRLDGDQLETLESITFVDESGQSQVFEVGTATESTAFANGLASVSLAVGKVFNMIIADAHGSSTFQVNFILQNGAVKSHHIESEAITADKLHHMNASNGDILVYNNVLKIWEARSISGQNLLGTWDANTNNPVLANGGINTTPNSGDYYIVGIAGATSIDGETSWTAGDWIIFNGASWEKVANSANISSFNGRTGAVLPQANDYTWGQIDKTTSSLNDIADVDALTPSSNEFLGWDGVKWTPLAIPVPNVASSNTDNNTIIADSNGNSSGDIQFQTGSTVKMTLSNEGDLSVGSDVGAGSGVSSISVGSSTEPSVLYLGEDSNNVGAVTWNNTNNYVSIGSRSSGTSYTDTLVVRDGRVGIGTSSPAVEFDVNTGTINAAQICDENNANCLDLSAGMSGDNLGNHTATSNLDLATHLLVGNGGSAGLAVRSNGSVLMSAASGTTDKYGQPASKVFAISGDGSNLTYSSGVLQLSNNRSTPSSSDILGRVTFASDGTALTSSTGLGAEIISRNEGAGGANGFGASLAFSTAANNATVLTERMRINSLGNVGIGTSSPAVELDVNTGTINAAQICDENNANCLDLSAGTSGDNLGNHTATANLDMGLNLIRRLAQGSAATPSLTFSANVNTGFYAHNLGEVGVTTGGSTHSRFTNSALETWGKNIYSTTNTSYHVSGAASSAGAPVYTFQADTDTGAFLAGTNVFGISTGGTEKFRVDASGNVGIGTTNPASKLDVSGTIRAQEICDETGTNCKDISAGWSGGSSALSDITSNHSATVGEKLMVNTSSAAITITLPASPTMGDVIEIYDITGSFNVNNLTLSRNGNNIMGLAEDMVVGEKNITMKLIYYDSTHGWRVH